VVALQGRCCDKAMSKQSERMRSARVAPPRGTDYRDQQFLLLELRRELDRIIARQAARRSTAQERARLLEMGKRLALRAADDEDILPYLRDH
jgi:DNA-binding GntR family transcriptional regulator